MAASSSSSSLHGFHPLPTCEVTGVRFISQCRKGFPAKAVMRKLTITNGFKIRESYDGSFQLDAERDSNLRSLLSSEVFCKQVGQEAGLVEASRVEFTGELFQPVPWSPTTLHGMPEEYNKYYDDKENYVIINVPPNFMFKAKVFNPSRLCAIYKKLPVDNTE